ncbi:BTAD domain-containing putative transcriptional regulator [Geodermatophilus sp. URMC 62]|uniref:BTAD domain-containing putative transcriptional regulator n=1 Tax=Geodermatophilus sp. URMC 62 TaxID=3423414 RepID=UPI00406C8C2A
MTGQRQRVVLAVLLLAQGRPVTLDRLVDAVWEVPPDTADKQVRNVVSSLRVPVGQLGASVGLMEGGYHLDLGRARLDLDEFEKHVQNARDRAAVGEAEDREGAVAEFRAALDLWRGPALAGLTSPVLRNRVLGLDEQRVAVFEECVALELYLGRHRSVVSELFQWVDEEPHRESLVALLMRALIASGARDLALKVYDQTREVLANNLGVEPGAELRGLRRQLTAEPARRAPTAGLMPVPQGQLRPAPSVAQAPPARGPCALPADIVDLVGRGCELARLSSLGKTTPDSPTTSTVVAIDGMPGVGKTALAVRAAHSLVDDFPDGQLFLDLQAYSPGQPPLDLSAAVTSLLVKVEVPVGMLPTRLPDRLDLWHRQVAHRRLLLVLDNAVDTAQVSPLLPAGPGCLTLVTSRRRLTGLHAAALVPLELPGPAEARNLFVQAVGDRRPLAEAVAVDEVVRHCGRLPLALRIAATRLRHRPAWSVAELAERLADPAHRLDELRTDDLSVADAMASSVHRLGPVGQRLMRLLEYQDEEIAPNTVAALADLTESQAGHMLEDLVDLHLVEPRGPDRYALHPLLRAYVSRLPGAELFGAGWGRDGRAA